MKKSDLLMDAFGVSSFFLSSQLRLSAVSVAFDFSASLINVAPASPMLLPVDGKRKEKSDLWMSFCVSSFCIHCIC